MPIKRLEKARASLPRGYQFGDAASATEAGTNQLRFQLATALEEAALKLLIDPSAMRILGRSMRTMRFDLPNPDHSESH